VQVLNNMELQACIVNYFITAEDIYKIYRAFGCAGITHHRFLCRPGTDKRFSVTGPATPKLFMIRACKIFGPGTSTQVKLVSDTGTH